MRHEELKKRIKDCIKYGDFTLHSGDKSNWICDLLKAKDVFLELMYELDSGIPGYLFGIEFGGALLASIYTDGKSGIIRKNGEIYLPYNPNSKIMIETGVTIIDDVVTTETSFIEAEKLLEKNGIKVYKRMVILDRRKESTLEIQSLFTAKDFNLE